MSFLNQRAGTEPNYAGLGYASNPFPRRGEVRPEVYVDRPEVRHLQRELIDFVNSNGLGGFWAVEGTRGVGKSNLLRHIEYSLDQREAAGTQPVIAFRYVAGLSVAPRQLAEQVVLAIGEAQLKAWLDTKPTAPSFLKGTDLGRFLDRSARLVERSPAAEFLARWLSCQQTYANQRTDFGIKTRERLEPGTAFPYLRCVVDGLVERCEFGGIVLLIDEIEDLLAIPVHQSTAYAMALKALVNTFNWHHLFVVLAGQQGAFVTFGEWHTSLAGRWRMVPLRQLENVEQAVELANSYIRHGALDKNLQTAKPDQTTIALAFGKLAGKGAVLQRTFLDVLHQWVEHQATQATQ